MSLIPSLLLILSAGVAVAADAGPLPSAALPDAWPALAADDEFTGPFAHWIDVKALGAKGDGKADDTAALQKALDLAKAGQEGKDGQATVYLPAGTYRITKTLELTETLGLGLIGADPATVTIRWDGEAGGSMAAFDGVSYSRFGRITWDGAKKAGVGVFHRWSGDKPHAGTWQEHADQVFKDMAIGIRGGIPHFMDAETTVKRCVFERCSGAGVAINSFNALDWWLWQCRFTDCGTGVTNALDGDYGGGHAHVYQSVFERSTVADIRIGHTSYFGLRRNHSTGSRRFLEAVRPAGIMKDGKRVGTWTDQESWGAQIALQANVVVDATDPTPIHMANHGPLLLVDNTILQKAGVSAPFAVVEPPTTGAAIIAIGNRTTGTDPYRVKGTLSVLDQATAAADAPRPAAPRLPVTPAITKRPVIAVKDGAGLIRAVAEAGTTRPIIALPAGRMVLPGTVTIPTGVDLDIVGEGERTWLMWDGPDGAPMIEFHGTPRARLSSLVLSGNWGPNDRKPGAGILATGVKGGRVALDQLNLDACKGAGLRAEGIIGTDISAIGFGLSSNPGTGVMVTGGDAWVTISGAGTSNNGITYDVAEGGRIMVADAWYETSHKNGEPRFVHARGAGDLAFWNIKVATMPSAEQRAMPAVELDGFRGTIAIVLPIFNLENAFFQQRGDATALVLGASFHHEPTWTGGANAALLTSRRMTDQSLGTVEAIPDQGTTDAERLRALLAPLRARVAAPQAEPAADATDLRLHRVRIAHRHQDGLVLRGK